MNEPLEITSSIMRPFGPTILKVDLPDTLIDKLLKLTDDPTSQFNLNSIPLSTSLFVLFKTISFSNLKFGMPYINKPPARS